MILKTNLKLRLPNTNLMKKNEEKIHKAFEKECIDFDDLNFGWILKTNVISAIDPPELGYI